jgi:hypothetical protein
VRKSLHVALLLLAAGCHRATTEEPVTPRTSASASPAAGANPRSALDAFLGAVKTQDLQAMSLAWGDKNGPVRDSKSMSRSEMEQREVYLMKCFRHDSYRVLNESAAAEGERVLQVELTRGTGKRTTDFFVAKGSSRWYVRSATLEPVKEMCSAR